MVGVARTVVVGLRVAVRRAVAAADRAVVVGGVGPPAVDRAAAEEAGMAVVGVGLLAAQPVLAAETSVGAVFARETVKQRPALTKQSRKVPEA